MHASCLRDDFLCKLKGMNFTPAPESFHKKVHLKYIVDFKFLQEIENFNKFLVIQL